MNLKALLLSCNAKECRAVETGLEINGAGDLERLRDQALPVAYIIHARLLAGLREFKDLIVDRGVKHKAKALSGYLLNQPKIPLIKGSFSDPGQLRRSVRTLLRNALEQNDQNLYFIGVDDPIWAELVEKSAPVQAAQAPHGSLERNEPGSEPRADWPASVIESFLQSELGAQCQVPEALTKQYVGASEDARRVRLLILRAASTEGPVLILGDTGTGKEIVAREIHNYGAHKEMKFIPVNCGGIPRDLLESELFGHVRGAFTGAVADKIGLWETASDGTLFLDEIGDLHLEHQTKILRALEHKVIRRVGGNEDIPVNARIVAATNRDLFSMVQSKEFREDLYYRLRGFLIRTAPLRSHPRDIPPLAQSLWRKITRGARGPLSADILKELQLYRWPGNCRELKMVLINLHGLFGASDLRVEHLKAVFYLEGQASAADDGAPQEKEIILHKARCLRHLRQVYDSIYTARATLETMAAASAGSEAAADGIENSLRFRLNELEALCRYPLFFYSEETFSAVHGLKGKLTYLLSLLAKDGSEARHYREAEVAGSLNAALSSVFKEIERVIGR